MYIPRGLTELSAGNGDHIGGYPQIIPKVAGVVIDWHRLPSSCGDRGFRFARETLDASLRNLQNTYEALILRQRIIQDRIGLSEKNIGLKTRTTADEQRKLEVGLEPR